MERAKSAMGWVWGVIKRHLVNVLVFVLFVSILIGINIFSYGVYQKIAGVDSGKSSEYFNDNSEEADKYKDCNVAGINIHGQIYTYIPDIQPMDLADAVSADSVAYHLREAEKNEDIKAIVIEIDSPGGSPVAGEELSNLLKNSKKPTVALIRQMGASAAYWTATGANTIFASKNSDIGSIGVTYSYLENVNKNRKDGLNFIELTSGKYKEMGNPDRELTEEEKALILRDLKIIHKNFISDVAKNRKLSFENISQIADGSTVLGEQALNLGLIDKIGDLLDVEKYLTQKLGEKAEICWN